MASDTDLAGNTWTLKILEAETMPTIICLLRANPASDAPASTDSRRAARLGQAGDAGDRIVIGNTPSAQVLNTAGIVPSMITALRDLPDFVGRFAAAHVLTMFAEARPADRRAMAEAGVIRLLLELYIKVGNEFWDIDKTGSGWNLARVLLCATSDRPCVSHELTWHSTP
jgi:hypothetical protein